MPMQTDGGVRVKMGGKAYKAWAMGYYGRRNQVKPGSPMIRPQWFWLLGRLSGAVSGIQPSGAGTGPGQGAIDLCVWEGGCRGKVSGELFPKNISSSLLPKIRSKRVPNRCHDFGWEGKEERGRGVAGRLDPPPGAILPWPKHCWRRRGPRVSTRDCWRRRWGLGTARRRPSRPGTTFSAQPPAGLRSAGGVGW